MTKALKVMVGAELEPTGAEGDLIGEDVVVKKSIAIIPSFTTSTTPIDITKLGNNRKRKNQLVARLKRRRHYAAPLRGGRGKQARTRRKKFG